MLRLPFFAELDKAQRILLAGAGGGYDVFTGLPLYFALRDAGKEVFLANLSFSRLDQVEGRRPAPAVVEITADTQRPPFAINYFPEGYLCRWFRQCGEEVSVFGLNRTGAVPLREAYQALVAELKPDTILLVDGGTDSLMRGDEFDLATPEEDIASIAAVDDIDVPRKLLACIGFGVDHYHGICHAHFLEAVAEVTRAGGFLGAFSLLLDMPEAQRFRSAAAAVFADMPHHPSIVSTSILSALEGHYGDHHATDRTAGSTLWINPLMTFYWCFRLDAVARRVMYLDEMKQTRNYGDVQNLILRFRSGCKNIRPWQDIPV